LLGSCCLDSSPLWYSGLANLNLECARMIVEEKGDGEVDCSYTYLYIEIPIVSPREYKPIIKSKRVFTFQLQSIAE